MIELSEDFIPKNLDNHTLHRYPQKLDPSLGRLRRKEWHYLYVADKDLFFSFGIVQLGYLSVLFSYFKFGDEVADFSIRSPFGRALKFSPNSEEGISIWKNSAAKGTITNTLNGHQLEFETRSKKFPLKVSLHFKKQSPMTLLYPLSSKRAAFTHKETGNEVVGSLIWKGEEKKIQARGGSDWTKSYANYTTRWKWASVVDLESDLAANLSSHVYDHYENSVWLNNDLKKAEGVKFEIPKNSLKDSWKISGEHIDLHFTPEGHRFENLNLLLIASQFSQVYGRYEGELFGQKLKNARGVAENHFARW